MSLLEKLHAKIKQQIDGCWRWTGGTTDKGYGTFSVDGKMIGVHRLMWELHYGSIPPGMLILHKCDNPPCCNPDHLELGTHSKNLHDAYARGRRTKPNNKGEKNPNARLSAKNVLEIRELSKTLSDREIARRLGISRGAVQGIRTRRRWKHI